MFNKKDFYLEKHIYENKYRKFVYLLTEKYQLDALTIEDLLNNEEQSLKIILQNLESENHYLLDVTFIVLAKKLQSNFYKKNSSHEKIVLSLLQHKSLVQALCPLFYCKTKLLRENFSVLMQRLPETDIFSHWWLKSLLIFICMEDNTKIKVIVSIISDRKEQLAVRAPLIHLLKLMGKIKLGDKSRSVCQSLIKTMEEEQTSDIRSLIVDAISTNEYNSDIVIRLIDTLKSEKSKRVCISILKLLTTARDFEYLTIPCLVEALKFDSTFQNKVVSKLSEKAIISIGKHGIPFIEKENRKKENQKIKVKIEKLLEILRKN